MNPQIDEQQLSDAAFFLVRLVVVLVIITPICYFLGQVPFENLLFAEGLTIVGGVLAFFVEVFLQAIPSQNLLNKLAYSVISILLTGALWLVLVPSYNSFLNGRSDLMWVAIAILQTWILTYWSYYSVKGFYSIIWT